MFKICSEHRHNTRRTQLKHNKMLIKVNLWAYPTPDVVVFWLCFTQTLLKFSKIAIFVIVGAVNCASIVNFSLQSAKIHRNQNSELPNVSKFQVLHFEKPQNWFHVKCWRINWNVFKDSWSFQRPFSSFLTFSE